MDSNTDQSVAHGHCGRVCDPGLSPQGRRAAVTRIDRLARSIGRPSVHRAGSEGWRRVLEGDRSANRHQHHSGQMFPRHARRVRTGSRWACNERALAHLVVAFISGSTAAWIGLGAADSTASSSDVFRFLRNAKPINPDRTRKPPATINQCGYSMAESISYFPSTFSPNPSHRLFCTFPAKG